VSQGVYRTYTQNLDAGKDRHVSVVFCSAPSLDSSMLDGGNINRSLRVRVVV
jgi:hypothetical protein